MTTTIDAVDAARFNRLYAANHERIRRMLARTAGPEEAEDLTQIVFAKAARSLAGFRGDARESTWLFRIAANVAADWLRARATKQAMATVSLGGAGADAPGLADRDPHIQAADDPLDRALFREEMGDCLLDLVEQLPDRHREVLVLGPLGGLTDAEIAQALGISRGSARVRLHRARAAFRAVLEARCDFSRDEFDELVCEPKPSHCTGACAEPEPSGAGAARHRGHDVS